MVRRIAEQKIILVILESWKSRFKNPNVEPTLKASLREISVILGLPG